MRLMLRFPPEEFATRNSGTGSWEQVPSSFKFGGTACWESLRLGRFGSHFDLIILGVCGGPLGLKALPRGRHNTTVFLGAFPMFAKTQSKIRQGASPILWKPRQSAPCVTQVEQFTMFPGISSECMQGQGTWEYPWNAGLKPKDK